VRAALRHKVTAAHKRGAGHARQAARRERRYIFDAGSTNIFNPADACPPYTVPEHIAAAVSEKQRRDDIETAELISRGTQTVPVATGTVGGMNPTFLGFGSN